MAFKDTFNNSSFIDSYEKRIEKYNWRGPEVAFGLSFAFINPGETILDIGIGTGLSSFLFYKAGLHVYGMDASIKMLDACRAKGFVEDLKEHDLTVQPYPYDTACIDHAVCLGVLNHFANIKPVFIEVSLILRKEGIFVFTVADRKEGEDRQFLVESENTQADANQAVMYRYSMEEISDILNDNNFILLKYLKFFLPMMRIKAYVAKKNNI